MHLSMCGYVHLSTMPTEARREVRALELELEGIGLCEQHVLGTELGSLISLAHALSF